MSAARPELVPVPKRVSEGASNDITDLSSYEQHYASASRDPDAYWLEQTRARLHWRTPPTLGLEGDFDSVRETPIRWFADGKLNVTESCLDRHLEKQGDKTAIIWEADEIGQGRSLSFRELHAEVCRCANVLMGLGVKKGDTVIIYMGMVPEAAIAMLACARLGAIHSVVFGGFSAEALRDRVSDCGATVIITQDEGRRGGRSIALKTVCDEALEGDEQVRKVLVYARTGASLPAVDGRDVDWATAMRAAPPQHDAVECGAEDPLFILYTSGSTGRPKGVMHTCAGYLTWTSYTHANVFDIRPDDVFACMADVGWITGHSYIVYGPLCNGTTSLMFESVPTYPDAGRYWDVVARHSVSVFYTAPTAIRALAAQDKSFVSRHDRSSLRVLGTVGEPINPEAWWWYFETVGEARCTIVDTWWQTETGGHCITPFAAATPTKAGSATRPVPGILTELRDGDSKVLEGAARGHLCITTPWPGMARTVWGDHPRYVSTYFTTHPGRYFTGDDCRRDADNYLFITGRVDDVLNVAGHRMGTAEFESALISDASVAEAAVVGFPHELKGQGVCAYLVMQPAAAEQDPAATASRLASVLRKRIGAHAKADRILLVPGLPKTRSGKVMRRILRKIAEGEAGAIGDVSTLADPSVVEAIKRIAAAGD
jgi:acetyl-CoA synthetase